MARPSRQGEIPGTRGKLLPGSDIRRLEYGDGGFGIPPGPPMRGSEFVLKAREWYRTTFYDRPVVVFFDTAFQGTISFNYCGPVQPGVYVPFSPAADYASDVCRPGQVAFLHKPAEWDFYANVDPVLTPTIKCRVVDAAFCHVFKSALNHIVGYDPTIAGHRTIGCTAADPARLLVDTGLSSPVGGGFPVVGVPLAALTPAHTAVSVGVASGLALAANANRKGALFVNDSIEEIYLNLGGAAALNTGIRLNAEGGSFTIDPTDPYLGLVNAIATGAASNLLVTEWT